MTQTPELVMIPVDESMDALEVAKSAEELLKHIAEADNGKSPQTFLVYGESIGCGVVADTVELVMENLDPGHKIESPELSTANKLGMMSLEFCLDQVVTDTPKFNTANSRIVMIAEPEVVRLAAGIGVGSLTKEAEVIHVDSMKVRDDKVPTIIPGTALLQKVPRIKEPEIEFSPRQKEKLKFKPIAAEKYYNEVNMGEYESLFADDNTRYNRHLTSSLTMTEEYAELRAALPKNKRTLQTFKLKDITIDIDAVLSEQHEKRDLEKRQLATVTQLPVTQPIQCVDTHIYELEAV